MVDADRSNAWYMSVRGWFIVIVSILAGCAQAPKGDARDFAKRIHPAEEYLPPGRHRVDVMDLPASSRQAVLQERLVSAMRKDREFWMAYIRANDRPGISLPYHSKMELSPTEYEELLVLMKQMRFVPVAQADLVITKKGSRLHIIDGGRSLGALNGLVIDLERDRIETPFGECDKRAAVDQRDDSIPTGRWRGLRWSCEDLDSVTMTGKQLQLGLGRLQGSGKVLLYYQVRQMRSGSMEAHVLQVLNYDAPLQ